jgi:2,3-diketo-5-methylthio-1-phosphopentane phosphatase
MSVSIFCDFDATISVEDVGDALFKNFGDFDTHWNEYSEGKYNIRELNKKLCNSLRPNLTYEEITGFAIKMPIDFYFAQFLEYCNQKQFNFTVVSDGYDAYINPILEFNKIFGYPIYCNFLKKNNSLNKNESGFEAVFFGAVECSERNFRTCTSASCKRNVVLNNSDEKDIIVYIGDGHTDFCAAEHSDIIFAKSKLATYCNENKIPHHPFKSFLDIKRILENSFNNGKLKQRNQSAMKRKSAFESE